MKRRSSNRNALALIAMAAGASLEIAELLVRVADEPERPRAPTPRRAPGPPPMRQLPLFRGV